MKELFIDAETYSDIDLSKSGVYRYVSSPNFEILLLAISVDDEPTKVYDLKCGDKLPIEIIEAIKSKDIKKWSFNASFERIVLSKYLGMEVGNYLVADFWVNLQVKRATMYIKASHFNAPLEELMQFSPNYFSLPHYPMEGFGLYWGVIWKFFN